MIDKEMLFVDKVRKLYDHTVFGSAATLINGTVLVFILRGRVPLSNLISWLGCALLLSIVRLSLNWSYRKTTPSYAETVTWRNLFVASLFLSGILWGAAGIVLFPSDSIGHQAFVAFVAGGMVAGAAGSFTSVLSAFFLFSIPALLPIIVRFFLMGDEIHLAMGTMALIFLLIMSLTAFQAHADYVRSLSLKYENRELLEAQDALRKGEEKYRELVENINDILFTIDGNCIVLYMSPVVEPVLGYRPEELTGEKFSKFVSPNDRPSIEADFKRALEKNIEAKEYRFFDKSGKIKWCRISTRPIANNDSATGIQGILADITESKLLEEQLRRAQKMEAIGNLAGGVAHDLNNILSGLVGYPDLLLLDMTPDSPLRGPISTIKASGERAAAVVQDLLTLARRGVPVSETLNLNRIVEEYLESPGFRKMESNHPRIRVETNLQEDLLNMTGSRVHLSTTLANLLANAAEAMPDGGTVVVKTENRYADAPVAGFDTVAEGEYVVLTVEDSGVGIEEEDLARIFEPFYTKKVMGRSGSGLGMAVVWGTVKDHGGYINAKSDKDSGSIFELFFPATRKSLPIETIKPSRKAFAGKGQLVLVIDDVKEQREIATKILLRLGYRAKTVAGGEEAVDFVSETKPDLILLDMIMDPGIDGYETYRRILKINPGQKAIIVSGYSETEQVRKTLSLGAGRYIRKPYTLETIGMAIKTELEA